ncbi:MAG: AbrB/MazE/SpoVT family DNA-binding domain-containing protein [Turicibacter sp.]|nr:AbrB/MazE/SpoVT family DNA-binding domain-containing protein [Turicibacter sp.]
MKATGVVRRIDDLGRVVIPKEIRRTMRIREGDSLEIFVNQSGEVVLKKYSPIADISSFAQQYAEAMSAITEKGVLIVDREDVIAAAGEIKKQYINRRVSRPLSDLIEARTTVQTEGTDTQVLEVVDGEQKERSFSMFPIIANGDSLGAVIVMGSEEDPYINELDVNTVQIAVGFLGKYLEN